MSLDAYLDRPEWCHECGDAWYSNSMKYIEVDDDKDNGMEGWAYFCCECKPELFMAEKRKTTIISHVDYNGEIDTGSLKNPANKTCVEFLTELASLFAKYEYTMAPIEETMISVIDKECNNVGWFYDICDHDDVADDYCLEAKVGNKADGSFDEVQITVTRACCANSKLETTIVDQWRGIGYTVCSNCGTKRDWK